jgi:hypothetical protein
MLDVQHSLVVFFHFGKLLPAQRGRIVVQVHAAVNLMFKH